MIQRRVGETEWMGLDSVISTGFREGVPEGYENCGLSHRSSVETHSVDAWARECVSDCITLIRDLREDTTLRNSPIRANHVGGRQRRASGGKALDAWPGVSARFGALVIKNPMVSGEQAVAAWWN